MPEYLSPGVYVEEVASGNQPIEGVSTSTTGLVGVTERGPVNVPQLVTSFGEFRRAFGGYLDATDFTDGTGRAHGYLPHAIEGFFVNGGKRAWVTRVVPEDAKRAERRLFFDDKTVASPEVTLLLRAAEEGTGTALNQPPLYALDAANVSVGDAIRVGDGSRAEYREVTAVGAAATHVGLGLPLQKGHATGTNVFHVARAVDAAWGALTLESAAAAGAAQLSMSGAAADITKLVALTSTTPQTLEVSTGFAVEYVQAIGATASDATHATVTVSTAIQRAHAKSTTLAAIKITPPVAETLAIAANAGDLLFFPSANASSYAAADLAVFESAANQEVRRIGALDAISLDRGAYEAYAAGSTVDRVSMADEARKVASATDGKTVVLTDITGIEAGMSLTFAVAGTATSVVQTVTPIAGGTTGTITLAPTLGATPAAASAVTNVQPRALTGDAAAGAVVISLDNRLGLAAGDVLRVGVSPNHELVTIKSVSAPASAPPNSGTVVIDSPLAIAHASGTAVQRQAAPALDTTAPYSTLVLATAAGGSSLLVGDGSTYALGDVVRVTTPSGAVHYHRVSAVAAPSPREITIKHPLLGSHLAGEAVDEREALLDVRALDPGDWGNRVLVSAANETRGLLARADVIAATASAGPGVPSTLKLSTVTGVEPGTVIQLLDPTGATQQGATLLKVKRVDRAAGNLVVLDAPGIQGDHLAAIAAYAPLPLVARSCEFRLDVLLLVPPSPAVPTRDNDILDGESFRNLSMDPRHSHYVERVIGSTFTDGATLDDMQPTPRPLRISDRRSQGASRYVRVHDLGASETVRESVRLGPEALTDTLPSGVVRAARLRLGVGEDEAVYGTDSVPTMDDAMYTGGDDDEPTKRTGIFALKNVQDIALVAVPGQTTGPVQQALIDHCEELRYRFAVLDSDGPDGDAIADVTAQRQLYDTKYAALYYPWLTIPDPFPPSLAEVPQLPIPPSGHVLGIFARSDDERGVHKAPANEVVRGITGLTRYLHKGEQDVLNAYPVNIDVIRDFRPNGRGIRVWGARCITSDGEYKYVNVRRLLIFLEDSIDRGLQWVVFEPNADELWARVRRSIANFLTTAWRNGALEGTAKEQAFFVKCDRTTMTQDDIDNGRLIVLIGVAPVKPAEFVIIRIGLFTADAQS